MKLPPAWRRKLLTEFLANTVITVREGARVCGRKETTVRYWLAKFRNGECTLEDARRSGRPKLLNSKAKKVIRDHLTRNTRATIASAAASVQKVVRVSARTVQREIYERAKSPLLYGQVPTAPISRANALLRKAATTAAMRRATKRKPRKLVFLDAANVWFKKGKVRGFKVERRHHSASSMTTPRFGEVKVHFYGAIALGMDGKGYRSELIFVPPTPGQQASFTAEIFINKVATPVLAWCRELYSDGEFEIVQDNAKQHNARCSQRWMQGEGYVLHEHPPQSPDLNRIEKVWATFKHSLSKRRPRSMAALFSCMQKEWKGLDSSILVKFINELPDVMERVHECPHKHDNK